MRKNNDLRVTAFHAHFTAKVKQTRILASDKSCANRSITRNAPSSVKLSVISETIAIDSPSKTNKPTSITCDRGNPL